MIIVRITLTEPKMVLAGVKLEISLARFKASASMAAFNTEIVPSRPLGRWNSPSMVETRSGCGRTVRKVLSPNRDGHPSPRGMPCANRSVL